MKGGRQTYLCRGTTWLLHLLRAPPRQNQAWRDHCALPPALFFLLLRRPHLALVIVIIVNTRIFFSCFFLYAILCNSSSCSGCSTFSSGDSLWTLSISILGGGGGGGGRGGVLPAQNSTQNDTISILRRTSWILFERRYPVLLEEGLTVGFIKKPRCERRESKLRCDLDT